MDIWVQKQLEHKCKTKVLITIIAPIETCHSSVSIQNIETLCQKFFFWISQLSGIGGQLKYVTNIYQCKIQKPYVRNSTELVDFLFDWWGMAQQ
jgi:hypothetical protein